MTHCVTNHVPPSLPVDAAVDTILLPVDYINTL
ncbi:YceK/YidQ family lipoprotein [Pseudomonas moraviensis subsp. stanleyae]|nr:YceK/YidQ family lipoprotein [Pseudomonas moraviensis subsp. stanleyae]